MNVDIISVGKKHEKSYDLLIQEYQKRMQQSLKVSWHLIKPSDVKTESEKIISTIQNYDYAILLDERGQVVSSNAFSKQIYTHLESSKKLCFIIGGAFGVSEELYNKVDYVLSLGKMVFPHQMVRLMLIEQVYKAFEIKKGSKYHHQ